MGESDRFESLPQRLFANAARLGSKVAQMYNVDGRWYPVSWRTVAATIADLAAGLIDRGHQPGDAVAILSDTRREWIYADLACQAAAGITVGVYPTLTAEQSRYILGHADAKFCVVENLVQLEKVIAVRDSLPALAWIFVIDAEGADLAAYGDSVVAYDALRTRGRAVGDRAVRERVEQIRGEDAAAFIYTSGTTGPPKGAMIAHGNIAASMAVAEFVGIGDVDVAYSFLPLAHALQRLVDYGALWLGLPNAYARGLAHVADDIQAVQPTAMTAVPRIFEKIYAGILAQVETSSPTARRIFEWASGVGAEVSRRRIGGEAIPRALAAQHRVADRLVFSKLRERLGGRIRLLLTGGAPIAPEILQFFDAAGITVLEAWGMTETFGVGTLNLPGATRFGSVGRPAPGMSMRLDSDGELLVKGPSVFSGYFKNEEATARSFTDDGYFRTGDIARVDDDGFYHIIDRKKDIIITAAGKNIAPQNIENHLKADPRVSQAVVIGDRRPYLVALIGLSPEVRGARPESELDEVAAEAIARVNAELPRYEQIKKFRILPRELSQEAGELTPTLKVKRKVVGESYAHLIEEMYSEPRSAQA